MSSVKGNMLIAHGGGPTAVINASLQGAIEEANKNQVIKGVFGAQFGIEGVLQECFYDLKAQDSKIVSGLQFTPSSALGSCRRKLTDEDYPKILEVFKKHDVRYFFYNGGNDSMDTCEKIYNYALQAGYELFVIGIPKTIDNDLMHTDHCPGFGSAARFAVISMMELRCDIESLPIHVSVAELMGRNTGWITAATALAKDRGPHLIYLPERPFSTERFLEDVSKAYSRNKSVLVAVSEGLKDECGNDIANSGIVDGFGHNIPGGVALHLADLINNKLKIKARYEKPGLLGRTSLAHQSSTDREEAFRVGAFAVRAALLGFSGYMVSLERVSSKPYICNTFLVELSKVSNLERKFPDEWINHEGNNIDERFFDYCMPLIGYEIPRYSRLNDNFIRGKT